QSLSVSAVKVDPNVSDRVYFGGASGRILRVDNASQQSNLVAGTLYADFPGTASVSSIYMDKQTSQDIIVSLFNYGAALENIFVTYNDGAEWTTIEGDLPDVPVRWAMFDPANHDRAMIATDVGVWTTDDINGDLTHWEPTNPENGMPFVRVDMLLLRDSDKVVLAATHGRGLMTTDVFSAATPVIVAQPIGYEGQTMLFDGSFSVNAQSYAWDFGDNTTSDQKTIIHAYSDPGVYIVSLTINGSLTLTRTVTILPYLSAPYQIGDSGYGGDFESHPEHFAPYLVSGTPFQKGSSNKAGKDGTYSGANAWVLGINDNLYQNNGRAELYTPQYDLSEPGLYEFKFWSKYAVQNLRDGFQVEYSLNSGASWIQLGTKSDPNWYNYHNSNISDGAFPQGKDYFTNAQLDWVHYIKDVSFLGGNPKVAFRFVFRSDERDPAQGLAIDDVELTKYEGELKTTVTVFNASYTGDQEVTINWTTGLEYQAKQFILERSYTGFKFDTIAIVNATGGISTVAQNYQWVDPNLRNVIYYRLRVISDNPSIPYHYEFYTPTIVVRRDVEENIVHTVLTNPFKDRILVSFSSIVTENVSIKLFDTSGKLIVDQLTTPNSVVIEIDNLRLPPGIYLVSVQIGEGEIKTYKLFSAGI
ncbi:MAG: PKD domain-containing protein, partial [Bacteroidota bacterium]|nr:PKD domain-containing protein [Bacteroidota bacterium]